VVPQTVMRDTEPDTMHLMLQGDMPSYRRLPDIGLAYLLAKAAPVFVKRLVG